MKSLGLTCLCHIKKRRIFMKKFISVKLAGNIVIVLMVLMIILHMLIMLRIVPYDIVWGGQIKNDASLMKLEVFALVTLFIFLAIILVKVDYLKFTKFKKITNIAVWIMFVYFLLNTVLNLASGVTLEKLIFTPITIILFVLIFRLAIEK
jgi:hypothetical protein